MANFEGAQRVTNSRGSSSQCSQAEVYDSSKLERNRARPAALSADEACQDSATWTQVARRLSEPGVQHLDMPPLHTPARRVHPVTLEVCDEAMAFPHLVVPDVPDQAVLPEKSVPCSPTMAYIVDHGGICGASHLMGGPPSMMALSMSEWL